MTHFGDRLTEANRRTATPLCMGIDPHTHMIPAIFGSVQDGAASDATIRAIDDFSMACLEQAIGNVAAIKPQAAFFEQQGPAGMQILQILAAPPSMLACLSSWMPNAAISEVPQPPMPAAGLGMTRHFQVMR